ncbi:MAG: winged helix-turn-helix transcriptional regulator, partial [Candidatus Hodarchaeales archaeon]
MAGRNNAKKISSDQKTIQEVLKLELAIFEILKQEIPSQIFLFLQTYRELSLKQLSEAIGKSKATILRHTKPMIENNIIKEFKKEGSRSKYFMSNPSRLNLSTPDIILPYIKKMTPEERREIYNSLVALEKSTLLMMKYVIDMTIR